MVNQRCLIVRLTKNQHERVRTNAEAKGYKTISSYIRALALEQNMNFEDKFNEIYNKLINDDSDTGEKENDVKLTRFL